MKRSTFTARRLQRIQAKYGPDSVAVFGGASLTTEKAYLMGKFARVALRTRHIDYNGRLCMVSAGTATSWRSTSIAPQSLERHPAADVIFVIGANIGECAPITTGLRLARPRQWGQADRRRSAHDAHLAQCGLYPARAARHATSRCSMGMLHVDDCAMA